MSSWLLLVAPKLRWSVGTDVAVYAAGGGAHSLALSAGGDVWACGSAGNGQLGLGAPRVDRYEFLLVKTLRKLGARASRGSFPSVPRPEAATSARSARSHARDLSLACARR